MSSVLLVVAVSAVAGLAYHLAIPIAWFILSRWLEGRALVIASVATSTAFGIGQASYSGPATLEAVSAFVRLAVTIAAGVLIARIWLARSGTRTEGGNG